MLIIPQDISQFNDKVKGTIDNKLEEKNERVKTTNFLNNNHDEIEQKKVIEPIITQQNEEVFECEICKKSFTSNKGLKVHNGHLHKGRVYPKKNNSTK